MGITLIFVNCLGAARRLFDDISRYAKKFARIFSVLKFLECRNGEKKTKIWDESLLSRGVREKLKQEN